MSSKRIPPCDHPGLDLESNLWNEGHRTIAGLDEAGRGAWAGPVYAAAVVLPCDERVMQVLHGVNDSKKMTPKQREHWQGCIKAVSVDWAVASSSEKEIDAMGIVPATCQAMKRALEKLKYAPTYLLIDYVQLPDCEMPQSNIPKGDAISLSIAAASILAKTTRDALMVKLDSKYKGYGFARHKGYGTAQHKAALEANGIIDIHRMSFAPMRLMGE